MQPNTFVAFCEMVPNRGLNTRLQFQKNHYCGVASLKKQVQEMKSGENVKLSNGISQEDKQ